MKKIYESLYPVGYKDTLVSDDFKTMVPYTEIEPLELDNPQSQYFDYGENQWKEALTQDVSAKLNLLEKLNQAANNEIEKLVDKVEKQTEETLNTQLAIAEIYETISGGEK